ncbi:long-chain-fatty-acid--CoA ligase [Mycobacterium branderi]|uniref:Long-chain-fatty-acid--CoA ligase FadD13 n=1 Tax=Mycobacterium branderi TaxID=43348 RepID=A0A7I7WC43_9MYCO|nr:long-chain-fatty-acid--CoA ligase [Mycobacterium branderi]MCV7232080.1 long-chain-fatty-acid--CoA ligase [Mycobacterium branderi]ORA31541.1 2-succinylbenzoyl-CoA synthetase [Mycobacterium branderi]BBZ14093.1 long-chain-fatty-acid--CoA ligase FadD13 [Mycobacterium branderi]
MNVGAHLSKRAELNPGLEALVDEAAGLRFSFAELNERADRTSHALTRLGLAKGDRVAVLLPNGHHFVETFYGAARSGLAVVPLNWRLVANELAFMLRDSGATVLVFDAEYDAVVADLREHGTPVRHWLRVGVDGPGWAADFEALVEQAPHDPVVVDGDGDDPLFIMYTSGTTGLPKGAVHTHDSVEWSVLTVLASVDIRFRDRYLISLPLFHVGALNPMVSCIYRGATIVMLRHFDAQRIWDVFRDEKVTITLAVPAMLNFMLPTYRPGLRESLTLRWIMSGASPVPVSLIESYANLGYEVHQVYGLTETCGPACVISPDDAMSHIGSTGKAFFHTDVRVVDDQGADVGPEASGEVLVRGRHIMAGYWNRPDATSETITDGWLHTGDVAVRDADGFIYIQDRLKDMIISGGENVYPAEIEDVLLSHPGIADAAVIGMPSAKWGESPLAVVVLADPNLDEAAVLAHCSGKLARFKLPKRAVFTDVIPRTPTGKALKRQLREQFSFDAPE